jgi:uncharacterized protein DUF5681
VNTNIGESLRSHDVASTDPPSQNAKAMLEKQRFKGRGPGRPFEKGKSGNPKGRPRNASSLTVLLREKLAEVCEYDKQQRTWQDMIVLATLKLAMEGNSSALREVWDRLGAPSPEEIASPPVRLVVRYEDSPIKNPAALSRNMSTSPDTTGPRT